MRTLARLALLAVALLGAAASASDYPRLGTLVSAGTSVSNSTTATPFTLGGPQAYSLQCDAAVYVVPGGTTATAAEGVYVAALELYPFWAAFGSYSLAILPVSGSANCKVFKYAGPVR